MDQESGQDLEDAEVEEQDDGEDATSSSSSATFRRDGTRIRSERSKAKQKQREGAAKGRQKDKGREERVVIVDINESGDGVTGVSSLSPSWQVLSAEIGKAPTWDKDGAESEGGRGELAGGLMLRIEGVGLDCGEPASSGGGAGAVGLGLAGGGSKGKGKEKEKERDGGGGGGDAQSGSTSAVGEEEMQILMEGFDRKMGILRRIVQRGSRESLVEGERDKS